MVIGALLWSPKPYCDSCTLTTSACVTAWQQQPGHCVAWAAPQMGGDCASQMSHEDTPLEAYMQRARDISSAFAVDIREFTRSPVVLLQN